MGCRDYLKKKKRKQPRVRERHSELGAVKAWIKPIHTVLVRNKTRNPTGEVSFKKTEQGLSAFRGRQVLKNRMKVKNPFFRKITFTGNSCAISRNSQTH